MRATAASSSITRGGSELIPNTDTRDGSDSVPGAAAVMPRTARLSRLPLHTGNSDDRTQALASA